MNSFPPKAVLFLFISSLIYSPNFAASLHNAFGRGTSMSQVASGMFYQGDINPAAFVNIPSYLIGGYFAPALLSQTSRPSETMNQDMGFFLGFPSETMGFYGEILGKSPQDTLSPQSLGFQYQGAGLGFGYRILPVLSVGAYVNYRQLDKPYGEINLGVLYNFPIDIPIAFGFGVFNVNFGLSFNSNRFALDSSFSAPLSNVYPAVGLQLFETQYLSLFYDNSISIYGEGRNILFLNGFRLNLFRYLELQSGFYGGDFFVSNFSYLGASLRLPLYWVDLNIFSGFGAKNYYKVTDAAFKEISVGFYLEYTFRNSNIISKTDSGLTTILEPKNMITPNGDGKDDFLKLHVLHANFSKLLDWNMVILDANLNEIAVVQPDILTRDSYGFHKFPKEILWYGTDYNGIRVKDGTYFFRIFVVTDTGEKLKWDAGSILLDAEKPDFNLLVENKNFFFGQKEPFVARLFDKNNDIDYYILRFMNIENKPIYEKRIISFGQKTTFEWNGYLRGQEQLPSGSYRLVVTAFDRAGNQTLKSEDELYFYESNKVVFLKMPYSIFSPNGDGRKDILPIELEVPIAHQYVQNWNIKFFSLTERKVVREIKGLNYIPQKVVWQGNTEEGASAPKGMYTANLEVHLVTGQVLKSLTYKMMLDTDPPFVNLNVRNAIFTPDNDGVDDTTRIDIDWEDQSAIYSYKIKISDPRVNEKSKEADIVRMVQGKDEMPYFYIWDGLLDSGIKVDSFQEYEMVIEAMDHAGNIGVSNRVKLKTEMLKNTLTKSRNLGSGGELKMSFPNLNFEFGSAIPKPTSIEILQRIEEFLKRYPRVLATIIGHTDKTGDYNSNLVMSQARADYVKSYLVTQGIPSGRLTAIGKSWDEPVYPHDHPTLAERNRRVEFIIKNETFRTNVRE